jgi:polyhydroxyalkanoate synthesis regulator phasin
MFESIDKMLLASLGAVSMTREKAEKIFDDYVAKGKAEKEAKTGFVKDMMDAADKTRTEFETMINKQVNEAMKNLNLAKSDDLARIEKKIDQLLAKQGGKQNI